MGAQDVRAIERQRGRTGARAAVVVRACVLWLTAAGVFPAEVATAQEAPEPQELERRIEAALGACEEDARERAVAELLALGAPAVPVLVEAFCAVEPGLSSLQERVVLDALQGFGPAGALPPVERRIQERAPPPERIALLRILGAIGREREIGLLLTLAGGLEHGEACEHAAGTNCDASENVVHAFRGALERILRRQAELPRLTSTILHCDEALQIAFIETLGRFRGKDAFEALCDLLYQGPSTPLVLGQLGALARDLAEAPDALALDALRRCLHDEEPRVLVRAAEVLAHVQDAASAARLVELLEHDEPEVVSTAEFALEAISGHDFRGNLARWKAWVSSEDDWFEERWPSLLEGLRSSEPPDLHRSMVEICSHRLHRHEVALELAQALAGSNAPLRLALCQILQQLGSRRVVQDLVRLLEDEDREVAQAAWQALRAITGLDLPATPEAWLQAQRS